jgi:hypothetical protein
VIVEQTSFEDILSGVQQRLSLPEPSYPLLVRLMALMGHDYLPRPVFGAGFVFMTTCMERLLLAGNQPDEIDEEMVDFPSIRSCLKFLP